jgi:hypothetical protein
MLKTASTILLIVVVFGAIYSLVLIVSPQTVSTLTDEDLQSPACIKRIFEVVRHMGALGLAANIAVFFILYNGFKKGLKWGWWGFLLTGIVGWGYGLVRFIINGDTKNLIGNLVGVVLLLAGILLPLKVFFPKKTAAS